FLASRPTPGVAVALHTPGQDRFFAFGYADREAQQPVTEDILFNLGSIEKVFTATLLASQVVDPASPAPKQLTAPVTAYLPPQVGDGALRQVTLQDLATHTSSMPRTAPGVSPPGQQLWNDQPPAPDLINWWRTWRPPADQPPGTRYAYSNAGFVTLGFAVVGQPGPPAAAGYPDLLTRTITEPLRMPVTATYVLPGQVLAKGYIRNGDTA